LKKLIFLGTLTGRLSSSRRAGSSPSIVKWLACASQVQGRKRTLIGNDVLKVPDCGPICGVLVAVDFLLLEGPVRKVLRVRPQSDLGRDVNELQVSRLALDGLALRRIPGQLNLEEGFVVTAVIVPVPGGELLVRRHQGRGDVVGQEESVGLHVKQLNNVVVADNAATTSLRK